MTDTTPVLAWHGDAALKADAVERMRRHAEQDEFIQLNYIELYDGGRWKGCFIGCLTAEAIAAEQGVDVPKINLRGTFWWRETERLFGIPRWLCVVLDDAFESCEPEDAPRFAVEVTEVIPVGADLGAIEGAVEAWHMNLSGGTRDHHARLVELLKAAPVPARAEG